MDSALQNAIKGFNPGKLSRAETVDKSVPKGVVAQDPVPAPRSSNVFDDDDDDDWGSDGGAVGGYSPPKAVVVRRESPVDSPVGSGRKDRKKKKKKKKSKKDKKRRESKKPEFEDIRSFDMAALDRMTVASHHPMLLHMFVLTFLAAMDFSIVLPSMYPLIEELGGSPWSSMSSTTFYGLVFVAYNIAVFLSAFVLNFWAERRPIREVLAASTIFMLAGDAIYCRADKGTRYMLLLGRALSGVGAGITISGYAHVARSTAKAQRPTRVGQFRWLENFGRLMAPALGAALIKAKFMFFMTVTEYNIAAFFMIILFGVFFVALLPTFYGRALCTQSWGIGALFGRSIAEEQETSQLFVDHDEEVSAPSAPLSTKETVSLNLLFVAMVFAFWAFEAALIPQTRDDDWSLLKNYLLFLYVGVIFFISLAVYRVFDIEQTSAKTLLVSVIIMIIGSITLTRFSGDSLPTWQLLIATAFIVVGFSVGTSQLPSMYAKLIGYQDDIGTPMSRFFAVVALARTAGPLWGAVAYGLSGLNLVAHTSASLLVLSLLAGFMCLTKSALDGDRSLSRHLMADTQPGYTRVGDSRRNSVHPL